MAASIWMFGCTDPIVDDGGDSDSDEQNAAEASKPAPVVSLSCTYPTATGSPGVGVGQVVPQFTTLSNGFMPGSTAPESFEFASAFDCDGSKVVHAIAVDTSQYG